MSYCRFVEGDVYAYVCDGGVQFYASDGKVRLDRLCNTFSEAYQYAKALRDIYGLNVPSHAIEALKADALEEAARICGPDSAVSELETENAKLRELSVTMLKCIEAHRQKKLVCWECPAHKQFDELRWLCCITHEASELGVEVEHE